MKMIYVAGPMSDGDVAVNVRKAMIIGTRIIQAGHAPFVPHLWHFLHMQKPQPYDTWIAIDNEFVKVCHAVYRIEGFSPGADAEVVLATSLGLPVFHNFFDLLVWANT